MPLSAASCANRVSTSAGSSIVNVGILLLPHLPHYTSSLWRLPGRTAHPVRADLRHDLALRLPCRVGDPEGAGLCLVLVVEEGDLLPIRGPGRDDVEPAHGGDP